MPRANDDSEKIGNGCASDSSKLTNCSTNSQGELSIYEIDILSYGSSSRKKNRLSKHETEGKWKVKLNESELVIENESLQSKDEVSGTFGIPFNPLIESHYPLLKSFRAEPDLTTISFEIDSKQRPTANETHHKYIFKKKTDSNKYPSLSSKGSKEKFKSQLRKLIIESFIAENDNKIKKLIKKLESESTHLHHHEHHHYYLNSSKARNIKKFFKMIRSTSEQSTDDESEQKKARAHEKRNTLTVNNTAAYFGGQSQNSTRPKTETSGLENSSSLSAKQRGSLSSLQVYSTDSFSDVKSDIVVTHSYSQTDTTGSDKTSVARGEAYGKTAIEPNIKDVTKLKPKKFLKPEYNELMESLRVLDKYLEPKMITRAKAKVSYIKCQGEAEEEDEVGGIKNQSSEAPDTSTTERRFGDESSNESTVKTIGSGKSPHASHFSAKRNNEPLRLKTTLHQVWTEYLKQELKDIKDRLRNIEKLRSQKIVDCLAFSMRGNNSELNFTPKQKVFIFSSKTYIIKADQKFFKGSSDEVDSLLKEQ